MSAIDPATVSLLVIAKEPRPGHAKTRLIPDLGADGAAAIARACLEDTLWGVADTPAAERVLVLDGAPGDWLPPGFRVISQREGGLADRLAGAFADSGAAPAVLVGMDTPQINGGLLAEAIERLCAEGTDAVLGPASDGGYWAIGLRHADPSVFAGVPMSSEETGEEQRRRLAQLGLAWSELEQLRDLDTIDDARAIAQVAPWTRCAAELRRLGREAA
jgi:rSAM/selenodomain-associated transferase 1